MTELDGLNFLAGIFGNALLVLFVIPAALLLLICLAYVIVMTIRELRKK